MENNQFQSIAEQNDDFRLHPSKGTFCLTSGIRALGKDCVREIIDIVRNFNNFNEDNDPYGEHDFGAFYYHNRQIFFKIDNYDREFLCSYRHAGTGVLKWNTMLYQRLI